MTAYPRENGCETRSIVPDGPFDLKRTLRPLGGWIDGSGWWRTMRTPNGPATLLVRRTSGAIEATAWGGGAEWCLEDLPGLVGLSDRWDLETEDPVVAALVRRLRGVRLGRTRLVTEALISAILAQRVTGAEAHRSGGALRRRYSNPAPGPVRAYLPPDPARIAGLPYYELHRSGIDKGRSDTLRRVGRESRRIDRLAERGPDETRARLERFRGVGRWSSAETVAVSHGDPDAVSVGDFHLKHQVVYHLTGRIRGSDEEMMELLEPFRPQRGRVARMLETLPHYPARGPRRPVGDIRDR